MRFTGAAIMAFQAPNATSGAAFTGARWDTGDGTGNAGAAYEGMVVQNYNLSDQSPFVKSTNNLCTRSPRNNTDGNVQ